jgi:hypothetical protein
VVTKTVPVVIPKKVDKVSLPEKPKQLKLRKPPLPPVVLEPPGRGMFKTLGMGGMNIIFNSSNRGKKAAKRPKTEVQPRSPKLELQPRPKTELRPRPPLQPLMPGILRGRPETRAERAKRRPAITQADVVTTETTQPFIKFLSNKRNANGQQKPKPILQPLRI